MENRGIRYTLTQSIGENTDGWGFLEESVSVLSMQNAAVSRPDKSLISASVHGNSVVSVSAEQMRRLCGPRGGTGREDVSVSAESDSSSEEGADYEAWLSCCVSKMSGGGRGGRMAMGGYCRWAVLLRTTSDLSGV